MRGRCRFVRRHPGRLYSRWHLPLSLRTRAPIKRRRRGAEDGSGAAAQAPLRSTSAIPDFIRTTPGGRCFATASRRSRALLRGLGVRSLLVGDALRRHFTVELDHENYSSSTELGGIQVADPPKGKERPNFLLMDPPGHTAQRRTVAPIALPSNLANFERADPRTHLRRARRLAKKRDVRLDRACLVDPPT